MTLSVQIAKQLREVFFGGNWSDSNLKDTLKGVTWEKATTKVESFNTIAELVYHINFFIAAVLKVLQGGPLDAKDKYSFDCPAIRSESDWNKLLEKTFADTEALANLVEQLPESKLWETFCEEKYGNYYRNIVVLSEHTHYHLGQIVLIKRMVNNSNH